MSVSSLSYRNVCRCGNRGVTLDHSNRPVCNRCAQGLPLKRDHAKAKRNAPCPCGSGFKFKQCCMKENER